MFLRGPVGLLAVCAMLVPYQRAWAEEAIGPRTSCRAVRAIFEAVPPAPARVDAVAIAVATAFLALDARYVADGRPALYGRLGREGRLHANVAVTVRCGEQPDESLGQAVGAVYGAIGAIEAGRRGAGK